MLLGFRAQLDVHLALELLYFTDGRQGFLLESLWHFGVRVSGEPRVSVGGNVNDDSLSEIPRTSSGKQRLFGRFPTLRAGLYIRPVRKATTYFKDSVLFAPIGILRRKFLLGIHFHILLNALRTAAPERTSRMRSSRAISLFISCWVTRPPPFPLAPATRLVCPNRAGRSLSLENLVARWGRRTQCRGCASSSVWSAVAPSAHP